MTLTTAPKDLIERRREMVSSLRLRGLTVREIATALAGQGMVNPETHEPYTHVTILSDLKTLKKEWRKNASADIAEHHARELAEIGEIKRAAWSQKDPELALKALDREVKLLGTLKQPDGLNININIELVQQTITALEAAGFDPAETFRGLIEKAKAKVVTG